MKDVRPDIAAAAIKLADTVIDVGPLEIDGVVKVVLCRVCGGCDKRGKLRHRRWCPYPDYEKLRKA